MPTNEVSTADDVPEGPGIANLSKVPRPDMIFCRLACPGHVGVGEVELGELARSIICLRSVQRFSGTDAPPRLSSQAVTNRPEGSDKRRRPTRTIPLQYLWGRAPRIDLYADRLRLVLPIYFGRKAIEVPLDQVAVTTVYPSSENILITTGRGIIEDGLSIPYLCTRFTTVLRDIPAIRPPNVMLVFATPARVPPLRKLATENTRVLLPFGYISSRAKNGVTIDGALLCVTNPDAVHRLASSGVEAVSDWRTWLRAHPRDDVAIRRDRKAADQHFMDVTRNLVVAWVLFLATVATAIVIFNLAT